ncbi:MAG: hypothetical protein IKW90_01890 [Lachnospiraceae bacterium]|nr:hypothetical protein [Lachnospiraceae bacterium]
MLYRISVDGAIKQVEVDMQKYSLEADNIAREKIIREYLDKENAREVVIYTTVEETRNYMAKRSGMGV